MSFFCVILSWNVESRIQFLKAQAGKGMENGIERRREMGGSMKRARKKRNWRRKRDDTSMTVIRSFTLRDWRVRRSHGRPYTILNETSTLGHVHVIEAVIARSWSVSLRLVLRVTSVTFPNAFIARSVFAICSNFGLFQDQEISNIGQYAKEWKNHLIFFTARRSALLNGLLCMRVCEREIERQYSLWCVSLNPAAHRERT